MKKIRESKWLKNLIAAGVIVPTLMFGAPDAEVEASKHHKDQKIERHEENYWDGSIDLDYISTSADYGEYGELHQLGRDLTTDWDELSFDKSSVISPSIKINKTISKTEDGDVGLYAQSGPNTSIKTNDQKSYEVNYAGSIEEMKVRHNSDLDINRIGFGLRFEPNVNDGEGGMKPYKMYIEAGGQLYRVNLEDQTDYIFPERDLRMNTDASADGQGYGFGMEAGLIYDVSDNMSINGKAFFKNGGADLEGEIHRYVDEGGYGGDYRELDADVDFSDLGFGVGVTVKF